METARTLTVYIALVSGVLCMWGYLTTVRIALSSKSGASTTSAKAAGHMQPKEGVPRAGLPSLDDISKLVESTAKLTDSMTKAGPALTALIGAVLLYAIAAAAASSFGGSAASAKPTGGTQNVNAPVGTHAAAADNKAMPH